MKKLLLFSIFSLLLFTTQAQQITFEKVIDTLLCREASCVQQTFDGGYIICGVSSMNNNDGAIVKLDSIGNIQWLKLYGGSGMDGFQRIEQLPDSGYVVSGTWNSGLNGKQWLLRLDDNGDTLWTGQYTVGSYMPRTRSMASGLSDLYPMNGYFLVQPNDNDAYLIVGDSIGGMAFYKTYGDTLTNSISEDVIKTYDNGYALTGAIGSSPGYGGVWLIKTDSLGDTLWTKVFIHGQISTGLSLQQTADSGFIIAGQCYDTAIVTYNIYLLKTNSTGDTLWTKVLNYPYENRANKINKSVGGGYIMAGSIIDTLPILAVKFLLLKINEFGDTIWTKRFDAYHGNYVSATKDGGFIAAGNKGLAFYIVKTDSSGNVNTGVGINEIRKSEFDFQIYPNPGSGLFNIEFNKNAPSFKIKVYNNLGELVLFKNVESCFNECQLDLSGRPAGFYYVIAEAGNSVAAKKLVLIK